MGFLDLNGLDINGDPDEKDRRSLAEVAALAASDRMVEPTQETTETFLRMQEKNKEAVKEFRWEFQDEFTDPARIGTVLSENEFLRRLAKLVAIKPNDWSTRGMRGLSAWKDGRYRYVGAIQCGYAPEFSIMNFDSHNLPTAEKYRGWRGTVLLRLILDGYITEEAAHREFGAPAWGDSASWLYRWKLWQFRNRKEEAHGR